MPAKPPFPPAPPSRTSAPHVQAAVARAAQAKLPERPASPGHPPQAAHVRRALAPAQAKLPPSVGQSRPQAPHVRHAIGAAQAKLSTPPQAKSGSGAVLQPRRILIPGLGAIETKDHEELALNSLIPRYLMKPGTFEHLKALVDAVDAGEFKDAPPPVASDERKDFKAGVPKISAAPAKTRPPLSLEEKRRQKALLTERYAKLQGQASGLKSSRGLPALYREIGDKFAVKPSETDLDGLTNLLDGLEGLILASQSTAPGADSKEIKAPAKVAPKPKAAAGDAKSQQLSPLAWAKLQDYSPLENGKGLRTGTLCNVEVYFNGSTKYLGKQTNAKLKATLANHAEQAWWRDHSEDLLAYVKGGCTAVLFHITRKPCSEGCDGWMKSVVYSAIKKAAGDRTILVLIKTYKDDDGQKHQYVLTAGALTDQGVW